MNSRFRLLIAFVAACVSALPVAAQQVPDRTFRPAIDAPAHPHGEGPVVCLDEAHANFHTLDNRFWAFGELLRRDGYVVRPLRAGLGGASLAQCRVLVIANAQPSEAEWADYPYPTPSAFTPEEIDATRRWVQEGGSLLLIADHMPLAGAAAALAAAFDVTFLDGFAVEDHAAEADRAAAFSKPTMFRAADRTLRPHAITRGRNPAEAVKQVRTFTGQAFQAPENAEPILVLPQTFAILLPEKAWRFGPDTRRKAVGGWLQGAEMEVGQGRAAFFGEAAMFSAQLSGPKRHPVGMNAPGAEENPQFVLNALHWLSGDL